MKKSEKFVDIKIYAGGHSQMKGVDASHKKNYYLAMTKGNINLCPVLLNTPICEMLYHAVCRMLMHNIDKSRHNESNFSS